METTKTELKEPYLLNVENQTTPITDHLISICGFTKISKYRENIELVDMNRFTCYKRIGDIHYLFYSEDLKYFDLAIRYLKPKGKAGGGFDEYKMITIPRPVYSIEDVDQVLIGVCNNKFI